MSKPLKWEKEEILRIYKRQRQNKRCEITRRLQKQADELTKTIVAKIKTLQNEKLLLLRDSQLAGINNSARYGCDIEKTHPELVKFDKATDNRVLEIIKGNL